MGIKRSPFMLVAIVTFVATFCLTATPLIFERERPLCFRRQEWRESGIEAGVHRLGKESWVPPLSAATPHPPALMPTDVAGIQTQRAEQQWQQKLLGNLNI